MAVGHHILPLLSVAVDTYPRQRGQTTPSTLTRNLPPEPVAVACYSLPPDRVAVGKGSDPKKIHKWGQIVLNYVKRVKTVNLTASTHQPPSAHSHSLPTSPMAADT